MAKAIDRVNVRNRLEPRREPYWGASIKRGLFLGFRRLDDGGTWVARWRDEDGRQRYRSLGHVTAAMGHEQAREAALTWLKNEQAGVDDKEVVTVLDACKAYVEDRRRANGEAAGHDLEIRLRKHVYEHAIAKVKLARVRKRHIEDWREDLLKVSEHSKATANRRLTALKAALNWAVANRHVGAEKAIEWESVKKYANADRRRELYLDLKQRRALLDHAEGAARNLIEAAMLTGARASELTNATRGQFDSRTGSMVFRSGKSGERKVPLSPAGATLFSKLAKGKLPGAHLFVRDDGTPWPHSGWDEFVREAAMKAKLPHGVCLYTLRHSFITQAITSGMSPLDVARLVGTSLTQIDKHYGHLCESAARDRLAGVTFA